MTTLLNVDRVNKQYKDSDFKLQDASLTIATNETVGLIGKNGSGKSTLINILVGNRHKDNGSILFFGEEHAMDDVEYKEHIGVVFDDLRVPNKLTIKDIDKVFQSIYTSWNSQKFFDLIKYFELPLQTKIKTFSRGMRMKIALTIALSHDVKLLILDEATAGMDVSGREEVMELLEDFVAQGGGILISSHISEDIEQLADKLVFMKDGRMILTEQKDILLAQYGIVTTEEKDVEIPKHLIIASRLSKGKYQILVKDYEEIENAEPLKHIDDATKIIMRGEV
ncbi:TPA: ABC transporter ATP-binding protein [Staphylococcus aureus]|uniref:ABC transporter ATP-binding protein n=5 Tax=Staphylococcus aureus TaxID=1280 RepID=A0A2S6DUN6_STAAU|nr:ABC transporter ATP-binding protein [Staphylococcus aureus]HDH6210742.1 ABC transporter ATP-binding protein [Staphylococcus aureus LTCF-12-55]HDH6225297.1 ABC transporter ATP-binding protein [Staphylococcus aureus LTCF-12-46]HDH6264397.1 ABC transporter ATP-binding protein [Staphylococcus aureus LTCF-7-30]HDH6422056.1 ABC transporter ATP-binding protein [Staphylococcus aureus MRSA-Lux-33]HDH6423289.1 ABC transporter ATP-binding protein [Staphylococcus aureus MRSA-Lux-34]HDH6427380.1 ABC tr